MGGWRGLGTDQIKWEGALYADSFVGDGTQITGLTDKFVYDYIYYDRKDTTPVVVISFDDGWNSVVTKAYPIMAANSQKGVMFVIPSRVGLPAGEYDYATLAQLQTVYNVGWDISSHGWNHQHMTTVSTGVMQSEIDRGDLWLIDNGFQSRKFFAYPFGEYNTEVINYLKSRNFCLAREVSGARNDHLDLSDDNERFAIKARDVHSAIAVSTAQGWIDQVIASGGLLVLLFHHIVDSGISDPTEYLTADFQSISDYLAGHETSGNLLVKTFSEYYAGYSRFRT